MNKNIPFKALLALLFPLMLHAQQRPQYTQYMLNQFALNPAIAGIEDYADIKLAHRAQWVGLEGAPSTSFFSAHMRVGGTNLDRTSANTRRWSRPGHYLQADGRYPKAAGRRRGSPWRHGIGLQALNDRIGAFDRQEAYLAYSLHFRGGAGYSFALGMSFGGVQERLNTAAIAFLQPGDPLAGMAGYTRATPDLNMGFWLYSGDFYVGASATQLLAPGQAAGPDQGPLSAYRRGHLFATAGYKWALSPYVSLVPSVMVKRTAPMPTSVDINLLAVLQDRFTAGVSYRTSGTVAVLSRVAVNHWLDVGYSYDYGASALDRFHSGSHELVVTLKPRNRFRILCPSNLW